MKKEILFYGFATISLIISILSALTGNGILMSIFVISYLIAMLILGVKITES